MSPARTILSRLEGDLRMAGKAPGTIQQYVASIRRCLEFLGQDLGSAPQELIRRWVEHLQEQGIGPERLRCHFSALRFLYARTLGQPEKVAFLSMPRKDAPRPTILSPAQVQRVLDSFFTVKYRTLFLLIYATGMRISEARQLRIEDILADRGVIRVRHQKGGGERLVPLPTPLLEALRTYYRHERPARPWLFTTRNGQPICAQTARYALLGASAVAGIGKVVTPHMLRHAFATHLLSHGTDLRTIHHPTRAKRREDRAACEARRVRRTEGKARANFFWDTATLPPRRSIPRLLRSGSRPSAVPWRT